MPDSEEITRRLRTELAATTPDVWPQIRRRLEAARTAGTLLQALEGPPAPGGRLHWELMLRLTSHTMREAV